MKNIIKLLPGIAVSFVIAVIAKYLESLLPVHIIGASVIALFIGMIVNSFLKTNVLTSGLKFTSKKYLNLLLFFWEHH